MPFGIVAFILLIVYLVFRKKDYRTSLILWWITLGLIIVSEIFLGISTNWGYWRGAVGEATGTLGDPGEVAGVFIVMMTFWIPTVIQIIEVIILLIFWPIKKMVVNQEQENIK